MKKKNIIIIIIVILIFLGLYYMSGKETVMEVNNQKVSFEPISNSYYYDQLDEREREAYGKIRELLDTCKGGVVSFEKPISSYNYLRVIRTLTYDETYRFWPFVAAHPFDNENKLVDIYQISYDEAIVGMYVQINEKEVRQEMKEFEIQLASDNTILNGNEFEELLETTNFDKEYYEEVCEKINEIEEGIIGQMPEDITEKEAVEYLCKWIRDNISYDYEIFSKNVEPVYENIAEANEYANSAYEHSIIEKKAICSGIAVILSRLCNKVGINSYVAIGTVTHAGTTIGHAWVAVEIAGKIYYTDPSYVCETGILYGIYLKNEMIRGKMADREYRFEESFIY